MKKGYLSTSQVAKAVGVHPNTVRLYEKYGLLPPVERTPKGYRLYTPYHLDQMRLARLAYSNPYPGTLIRHSAVEVIKLTAAKDLGGALESAYRHLAVVHAEQAQADAAVLLLQRWASGAAAEARGRQLRIGDVAALLRLTVDQLRNWERNGLVEVPRDPHNGYRLYSEVEIGRLRVIRMLRNAGYSPMAILRMLTLLDASVQDSEGNPADPATAADLRAALDTPREDEDAVMATDRWISTLAFQEQVAHQMIALVEDMVARYSPVRYTPV